MTAQQAVLQEIRQGRNTVRAISLSRPEIPEDAIRTTVHSLLFRGDIERVGRGKYAIPDTVVG